MPAVAEKPSYREMITSLGVNESFSFTRRLDQDTATREEIAEVERQLANVARAQMARAKEHTGHVYTGDLLDARTRSTRDPVILYVVTRTK